MNTVSIKIDGMHCDGCAARIKALLEGAPGVRGATVSFADGLARVRYNAHAVSENELVAVIEAGGFNVPARQS